MPETDIFSLHHLEQQDRHNRLSELYEVTQKASRRLKPRQSLLPPMQHFMDRGPSHINGEFIPKLDRKSDKPDRWTGLQVAYTETNGITSLQPIGLVSVRPHVSIVVDPVNQHEKDASIELEDVVIIDSWTAIDDSESLLELYRKGVTVARELFSEGNLVVATEATADPQKANGLSSHLRPKKQFLKTASTDKVNNEQLIARVLPVIVAEGKISRSDRHQWTLKPQNGVVLGQYIPNSEGIIG